MAKFTSQLTPGGSTQPRVRIKNRTKDSISRSKLNPVLETSIGLEVTCLCRHVLGGGDHRIATPSLATGDGEGVNIQKVHVPVVGSYYSSV